MPWSSDSSVTLWRRLRLSVVPEEGIERKPP